MQIGEKSVENMFMNMVIKKKIQKHKSKKTSFHAYLLENELNKL
jgi:hypothetical protein